MFRLLWTFVDLKLPSAMSHAIHKIVSIKRCQSYFISRRSPHLGISKDIHIASLLVKPEKLKVDLNIEYVAMNIPND